MRYDGLTVDPVFYEVIWLGQDETRQPSGFADAHMVTEPAWRVVAGYLMLSEASHDTIERALTIFSHGRRVSKLTGVNDGSFVLTFNRPPSLDGPILRSRAGLAVVPDTNTTISVSREDPCVAVIGAQDNGALGFTIVHGPAEGKVENRIRLLDSLRRLKERHG